MVSHPVWCWVRTRERILVIGTPPRTHLEEFLYIPIKKLLYTEPFMVEAEEFSFFCKEPLYSIDYLFWYVFSVDIRFSHCWIVIGSLGDIGDEWGIDWWCEDIDSLEERLTAVTSESDSHTWNSDDIGFFLHTARVSHHTSCMRDHIHDFMVMC